MSYCKRFDATRDENELEIVYALQWVGAKVHRLDQPCDLLVRFRGTNHLLEVSGPRRGKRKKKQLDLFAEFEVVIVKTSEEALRAIGAWNEQSYGGTQ